MTLYSISGSRRRSTLLGIPLAVFAVLAIWFLFIRQPPIPNRTLRIGFEVNPPVQIRTATGFEGLAVETVNEAAKRAGISLQWIETGTSSDEAFRRGLVDLWPIMADLPERRSRIHISKPWLHASHTLVMQAGTTVPGPDFAGRIAVFRMPIHVRLISTEYPGAELLQLPDIQAVVQEVCKGTAAAGFLEDRAAMTVLRERPAECGAVALRSEKLPHMRYPLGVGSTFESAGAADKIRDEIGNLYRNGTLAVTMAKYSYYGLEQTWATYDLMEAAERSRWLAWGIGVLGIALGITVWQAASLRQRKRSEAAVRESEARFRAMFNQAAVGVVQVSLDGSVTMVNQRCCELLGYSREELLGSKWLDKVNPDDRAAGLALWQQPLPDDSPHFSMELRCVRKNGDLAWVRLFRSLVDEGGSRAKYFVAVIEDITQRKQAEAALEESERRFRSMADTAPVLIWVAGPDMLCTFFNQEYLKFIGGTMEQALGNGWSLRIHPDDREQCQSNYVESFAGRRAFQTECRLQRADGEYRWVLATGVPRFEASGVFAGYVGSCTDTTEVKRTQEEALASQHLEGLGVMARGIAHDFNNLLGSILATSELILSEIPRHSAPHGQVESIKKVAERAAEIVRQMLAYAGRDDTRLEPLDLSMLVTEMLELMKASISKRAALSVCLPEDLPPVLANAAQIRQVVMNLITNASEALEEKEGSIFVSAEHVLAQGFGGLRLIVRDTGCGMSEQVLARIFDPFFTTKFTGRGLGLAATQGILRDHGGSIQVVSAPGQGSRFEVWLPCTDQPVRQAAAVNASSAMAQRGEGNVMVVDDEDELRVAVSKMLRKKGFSVIEASDGLAGVELFAADPAAVDIVLLDLTLPRLGGQEVLEQLRAIRPDIKVIITTAYSRNTVEQAVGENQSWFYIRKPYRISELTDLLRNVWQQVRAGETLNR